MAQVAGQLAPCAWPSSSAGWYSDDVADSLQGLGAPVSVVGLFGFKRGVGPRCGWGATVAGCSSTTQRVTR